MPIKAAVFDAYGTLFDVAAAARQAASEPDFAAIRDDWPALADHWRLKQLQYTWLRAITGDHTDFWAVTGDGLDWALERAGHDGDTALRERLMAIDPEGTRVQVFVADVSNVEDMEQARAEIQDALGPISGIIHIL